MFRSETTLVKVEAHVYDRITGQPIRHLQAADFEIHDEDQPREIVYFGSEAAPLDLVLLFDVSGSMRELLPNVAEQAAGALSQLRPGDRVAVMAFAKAWAITP